MLNNSKGTTSRISAILRDCLVSMAPKALMVNLAQWYVYFAASYDNSFL